MIRALADWLLADLRLPKGVFVAVKQVHPLVVGYVPRLFDPVDLVAAEVVEDGRLCEAKTVSVAP